MSGRHSGLAVLVAVVWGVNFVVIDEGLIGLAAVVLGERATRRQLVGVGAAVLRSRRAAVASPA